jgi:hypothetical protein
MKRLQDKVAANLSGPGLFLNVQDGPNHTEQFFTTASQEQSGDNGDIAQSVSSFLQFEGVDAATAGQQISDFLSKAEQKLPTPPPAAVAQAASTSVSPRTTSGGGGK